MVLACKALHFSFARKTLFKTAEIKAKSLTVCLLLTLLSFICSEQSRKAEPGGTPGCVCWEKLYLPLLLGPGTHCPSATCSIK